MMLVPRYHAVANHLGNEIGLGGKIPRQVFQSRFDPSQRGESKTSRTRPLQKGTERTQPRLPKMRNVRVRERTVVRVRDRPIARARGEAGPKVPPIGTLSPPHVAGLGACLAAGPLDDRDLLQPVAGRKDERLHVGAQEQHEHPLDLRSEVHHARPVVVLGIVPKGYKPPNPAAGRIW